MAITPITRNNINIEKVPIEEKHSGTGGNDNTLPPELLNLIPPEIQEGLKKLQSEAETYMKEMNVDSYELFKSMFNNMKKN